jgi:hypothetical protein
MKKSELTKVAATLCRAYREEAKSAAAAARTLKEVINSSNFGEEVDNILVNAGIATIVGGKLTAKSVDALRTYIVANVPYLLINPDNTLTPLARRNCRVIKCDGNKCVCHTLGNTNWSTATLSLLKSVIVGATTYQHRMHYNAQVWCSNLPATNAQRHYYMEALKPAAKEGIDTLVGVID